ncbi:YARHG domain-containing protein [Flavobacterium sp. RHBU_24]|uniref:YARHG domain-containing protein n=1 Tax=Flavobacterium sp. RHBU_24 TaxID=3391185 RepID=UPI00398521F5
MKTIFVTVAALLMLVGCKETIKEAPALADNRDMAVRGGVNLDKLGNVVVDEYAEYYGIWEGEIGDDTAAVVMPARLKIISIEKGKVLANATIDNKKMNISGVQQTKEGKFYLRLNKGYGKRESNVLELWQEGDNFEGTYYEKSGQPGSKVTFTHKVFKYDPTVMLANEYSIIDWDTSKQVTKSYTDEEGKKHTYKREGNRSTSRPLPALNGSTQKLTEEQLKNLRKMDLEVLRNTIYARHGYAFERSYLRRLFDSNEWYVPISDNVEKELTTLEKQNIALLTRVEKYAQDHYEYFGR